LTFDISKAYLDYLGRRGEAMKNELEDAAWKHLVTGIDDVSIARHYAHLRAEYVENRTNESKIVHAADALDILLQVIEYRRRGYPASLLAGLWNETNKRLSRIDVASVRTIHAMTRKEERRLWSHRTIK
jgi:5'-deoxynucleotidase YfbR-like HD superfamily hydrolase